MTQQFEYLFAINNDPRFTLWDSMMHLHGVAVDIFQLFLDSTIPVEYGNYIIPVVDSEAIKQFDNRE